MKRLSVVLLFLALMTLPIFSAQAAPPLKGRMPASELNFVQALLHGEIRDINPPGFTRKPAKIILPVQYGDKDKWPLVVLLHGVGGNAQATDFYLTLRFRTSIRGFILVTPEGTVTPEGVKDFSGKQFWNATDFCCDFGDTKVNDVDYLSKLIDTVQKNYRIDADRIYLIGHSNGGFMANRLACEIGERLAGIASLAGGSLKKASDCRKPVPISFLQIHAVNDPTVLYNEVDRYAGGKAAVEQWVKRNTRSGVASDGPKKDFLFMIPGPETATQAWSCAQGTNVAFWTIDSATLPNHSPHVPLFNLNFSDEVLNFLFQQKRAVK